MIKLFSILFIFFINTLEVEENDVFKAQIDSSLTEKGLEELITKGEKKNIDITATYVSFTSSGHVKVLQLKVDSNDGFSGSFTGDFSKNRNLCVEIVRDFGENSKEALYIGDCR